MKSMEPKGATGKVELSSQFLAEKKFTFQRAISTVVYNCDIPADLVMNLDQKPFMRIPWKVYIQLRW